MCPYERECEATALALTAHLPYRGPLKVTMAESSSSIVVRSESQYNKNERLRLSLRKHLYELNECGEQYIQLNESFIELVRGAIHGVAITAAQRDMAIKHLREIAENNRTLHGSVLRQKLRAALANDLSPPMTDYCASKIVDTAAASGRCHAIGGTDRFGRYLGFVDLRLASSRAPIALALLVPPRHIRHDARTRVIVGEYGPIFGAHGFASSAYSMHEPVLGGARCAQACLISSLVTLSDRGARILGSYELTFLAKQPDPTATAKLRGDLRDRHAKCLVHRPQSHSSVFRVSGLKFQEAEALLNNQACRVSAHGLRPGNVESELQADLRLIAERLIEAYALARCPVILFVDSKVWNPSYAENTGHAVTIVGIRYDDCRSWRRGRRLSELVIHDPGYKPYITVPLEHCFRASEAFERGSPDLNILFTGDRKLEKHAHECMLAIMQRSHLGLGRESDPELLVLYCTEAHKDIRISLSHRDDIAQEFFAADEELFRSSAAQLRQFRDDVRYHFDRHLVNGWYWCIGGYEEGRLRTVWAFNRQRTSTLPKGQKWDDTPWEWRFHVLDDGSIHQQYSAVALARVAPVVTEPSKPPPFRIAEPREEKVAARALLPAVLTSSSERSLHELCAEVGAISGVQRFEVFLLRERDVQDLRGKYPILPAAPSTAEEYSTMEVLAHDVNRSSILAWLQEQLPPDAVISAFATYLPEITSVSLADDHDGASGYAALPRALAQDALANCICLGLELQAQRPLQIPNVIVEMVCGSIVDRCRCADCQVEGSDDLVFVADKASKIRLLLDSLRTVVEKVRLRQPPAGRWCLALELEPGETYVVNDRESLLECMRLLDDEYADLRPYVGLNIDVAHMRMAAVMPALLQKFEASIANAHISDHPGMHTRDQKLGRWSPVDRYESEDYPYLAVLADSLNARQESGLPHSGSVSLELEGCNRISWIHDSLAAMKQMFRTIRHHRREVRQIHKI